MNLLKSDIDKCNPHVICITETWFKGESRTVLEGYSLFHAMGCGKKGGGVAIYIKDNIQSSEIDNTQLRSTNFLSFSSF
jgi:hypothetical protein